MWKVNMGEYSLFKLLYPYAVISSKVEQKLVPN
jgi:hypothetical protein